MKPKHHWLLDIPAQLRRDGQVLDAFAIESQHIFVKSVAEKADNTSLYESSVLASIMTVQGQEAEEGGSYVDGLVGGTSCLECFPRALVANKVSIGCLMVIVGDFVARRTDASIVVVCALEGETLLLIIASTLKVADVTSKIVRLRRSSELAVWRAAEVRQRSGPDGTTVF